VKRKRGALSPSRWRSPLRSKRSPADHIACSCGTMKRMVGQQRFLTFQDSAPPGIRCEEMMAIVDEAKLLWIAAALAEGQSVPIPREALIATR